MKIPYKTIITWGQSAVSGVLCHGEHKKYCNEKVLPIN